MLLAAAAVPTIAGNPKPDPTPGDLDVGDVTMAILHAIVESAKPGLQLVDPVSLNPPALQEDEPWFGPIPYDKCFRTPSGITCVAYTRTHTVGDGSLDGQGGIPVDWGLVCPQGFSLFQQAQVTWTIARFYTSSGDVVARYRIERYDGTVYNAVTGKAARMSQSDIYTSQWSPPAQNETVEIFGNDWSAFTLKGKPLLQSRGTITFNPDGSWEQTGKHPLDMYFLEGDTSGIEALCSYVK